MAIHVRNAKPQDELDLTEVDYVVCGPMTAPVVVPAHSDTPQAKPDVTFLVVVDPLVADETARYLVRCPSLESATPGLNGYSRELSTSFTRSLPVTEVLEPQSQADRKGNPHWRQFQGGGGLLLRWSIESPPQSRRSS